MIEWREVNRRLDAIADAERPQQTQTPSPGFPNAHVPERDVRRRGRRCGGARARAAA